ncbi:MAG: hypothetical protein ACTHKG_04635 [Nocardioides sp.]
MTAWSPGDGSAEVLSHGGDAPRPRRSAPVAAAVALLVVGAVLGAGFALGFRDDLPWSGRAAAVPALTGGSVEAASAPTERHRYRVALFNPGPGTVHDVQVVAVVGRAVTVESGRPVDIDPGTWRGVTFSLPDECSSPATRLAQGLLVRTHPETQGAVEQEVPLQSTGVLRDNHERECLPSTALRRSDLGGLWVLAEDEGRWSDLAGASLMRFTADGRFAFDPEGRLFGGDQGWRGTYRVHRDQLVLRGDGGYACAAGYSEVWTTTLLADGVLRLDVVRSSPGYCHTPPGERQVLRRLVPESRLPDA